MIKNTLLFFVIICAFLVESLMGQVAVDTFFFCTRTSNGQGNVVLDSTIDYRIEIDGTFSVWTPLTNACGFPEPAVRYTCGGVNQLAALDPEYVFAAPIGHNLCNNIPSNHGNVALNLGNGWFDPQPIDSGYNSEHKYIYRVLGAGQNLGIRFSDTQYSDNYGALRIIVFKSIPQPDPPKNLIATLVGNQVTLTWTPNIEPDLLRYRIYRDTESPATTLHDSVTSGTSTYIDTMNIDTTKVYFYRIKAVDVDLNVSEFSNEATTFVQKYPDLEVTQIQSTNPVYSGQTIQVSWAITNIGDIGTNAPEWYDRVYLSPTPQFDPEYTLGTFQNFSYLSSGEAYSQTKTFTLPQGIQGNYYIFIRADVHNQLSEFDENNNLKEDTTNVILTPPPDLRVTNIVAPTNAFSGEVINVQWTIKNVGSGTTEVDHWYDTVFLSDDDTLDYHYTIIPDLITFQDPYFAKIEHIGTLAPGDSFIASASFVLPYDQYGVYSIFVYGDINPTPPNPPHDLGLAHDRGDVYEHVYDFNNTLRHDINITLTPPPDLVVTDVAATKDTVSNGETISVRWSVQNQGLNAPFKQSWRDRIYFSPDSIFNPDSVIAVGSFNYNGLLEPDSSYFMQKSVTTPISISGTYYIFVKTDWDNQIFEHIWENNNVSDSSIVPVEVLSPDLAVTDITIPDTGSSGKSIFVDWNVQNQGLGKLINRSWSDRLYLSTHPVFDPDSAIQMWSFSQSRNLQPDSSYTKQIGITLPNGISGSYYVFLKSDADNQIFENQLETNNLLRSGTTININLSPWPDLQVDAVMVQDSTTGGENIVVNWNVTNHGTIPTPGSSWTDRIYLSASPVWDGTYILTKNVDHNGMLANDSSYSEIGLMGLPANIGGVYYIYIQTDVNNVVYEHTDENNNITRSNLLTVQPYPPVDLAVTSLSAPDSGQSGHPFTIQWNVENIGVAKTLGTGWQDVAYLSADTILNSNNDILLTTVGFSGVLNPSQSYFRTNTINLPNGISGSYYVIVKTDVNGQVNDADSTNNVRITTSQSTIALTPPADLHVTNLNAPAQSNSGQPITVSWTLENQGIGATAASTWYDAVYLSQNNTLENSDIQLGNLKHEGILAASSSYQDSMQVDLPNYISGTYYLILNTDNRNDVYEYQAEDNNIRAIPIDLILPPPADLIVTSIIMPDSAVPGEPATFSWTIKNIGVNPAVGYLRDAVYISADTSWEVSDPLVGTDYRYINLAPGAAVDVTITADLADATLADSIGNLLETLPGVTPGNYYVIVRTDIRNNIRESDVTNNSKASIDTMNIDVLELQLGVPITGTLAQGQMIYYRIDVGADLDLRIAFDSDDGGSSNELYVAFGRIPTLFDFDFSAAEPFQSNQELIIPSTQTGTCYIFIMARNIPSITEDFSLIVEALPFSILSITPDYGGQNGLVSCTIFGAGFTDLISVFLRSAQDSVTEAEKIVIKSSMELKIRWNTIGLELGNYDVLIIKNDSNTVELLDAFSIETTVFDQLDTQVIGSENARRGTMHVLDIFVNNGNNIDIDMVGLTVAFPAEQKVKIETTDFYGRPLPFEIFNQYDSLNAGIPMGNIAVINAFAKNVTVNQILKARIKLFNINPTSISQLPIFVKAFGMTKEDFIFRELAAFAELREATLALDPNVVPQQIIELLSPDSSSSDYIQSVINSGFIGDNPITLPTMPLEYDPSFNYPLPIPNPTLLIDFDVVDCLNIVDFVSYTAGLIQWGGAVLVVLAEGTTVGGFLLLAGSAALFTYDFYKFSCGLMQRAGLGDCPPWVNDINNTWTHIFGGIIALKEAQKLKHGPYIYVLSNIGRFTCLLIFRAFDPNKISGPNGFGKEKWISVNQDLFYTINFENDSTFATAPAQNVTITQQLDSTLDERTFRLGSFGFDSFVFNVPPNTAYYTQRLDVTDSLGVFVDIFAGIDVNTNQIFWNFRSIDPATGQPPINPLVGFLPVNDSQGHGQGFVNYTIKAKDTSQTGDIINAQASIVFDTNNPVDTAPIFNTIDAGNPVSSVDSLPEISATTSFIVSWSGMDDGSGIGSYDVYVSVDGAPFEIWLSDTTGTAEIFQGEFGKTYRFYSIARDNVGNTEPQKTTPDAFTVVAGNAPVFISDLPPVYMYEDSTLSLPLSAWFGYVVDANNPDSTLIWSIIGNDRVSTTIVVDTVIFSSPSNWFGIDTLMVIVSDSSLSDSTHLLVTVNSVNDPPVIDSIPDIVFPEDSSYQFDLDTLVMDLDNDTTEINWTASFPANILAEVKTRMEKKYLGQKRITEELRLKKSIDRRAKAETKASRLEAQEKQSFDAEEKQKNRLKSENKFEPNLKQPTSSVNKTRKERNAVETGRADQKVKRKQNLDSRFATEINEWNRMNSVFEVNDAERNLIPPQTDQLKIVQYHKRTSTSHNSQLSGTLSTNALPPTISGRRNIASVVGMVLGENDSIMISIDSLTHIATITATSNFNGFDIPVIFTATDPDNASDSDTTSITVIPVNDAPLSFNLLYPMYGDTLSRIDSINFVWQPSFDIDNDTLVYILSIFNNTLSTIVDSIPDTSYTFKGTGVLLPGVTYQWLVLVTDEIDTVSSIDTLSIVVSDTITGIQDILTNLPRAFALHQNYPNPFNPTTTIRYDLPKPTKVVLKIYNILGQEIITLVNEDQLPGYKSVIWDSKNKEGNVVGSGVYIYRIETKEFKKALRLMLLK